MQDLGAAGLTSQFDRMRRRGGVGIEIDVALVSSSRTRNDAVRSDAQREPGADARWSSEEGAERSSRSSTVGRLHSDEIGRVTEDGNVEFGTGAVVCDVPAHALHGRMPDLRTGRG